MHHLKGAVYGVHGVAWLVQGLSSPSGTEGKREPSTIWDRVVRPTSYLTFITHGGDGHGGHHEIHTPILWYDDIIFP